jgi:ectoine hydroxylase-related dioxygenase (phytanoyl-CoA dioxygenase family)
MWKDTALLEGAKEVHMRAGDALLFTDSMLHGATARRNAGQRRTVVMRYMPQHNNTNRFGCQ